MRKEYIIDHIERNEKLIPRVTSIYSSYDLLGAIMVRWGINRNHYRVSPGLFAIGNPDSSSDIFVTANYKLSFDHLRKNLSGINGWILVLDTRGVNVWCAAGKGTFSTKELVRRIRETGIEKIVDHRKLILPQLGATGIAAHKVKEETGFNVQYGPVRASDIKKFIAQGYRAAKEMRKVTFDLSDRIRLIPNDFIYSKYYFLAAVAVVLLLSAIDGGVFSFRYIAEKGFVAVMNVFLAYVSGIVITPLLLPVIPARRFSVKGLYTGIVTFFVLFLMRFTGNNLFEEISWFLIITSISSFLSMNFTGSSTYTSLSGVQKEMKISLPMQIAFAATGIITQIIGKLI